MGNVPEHKQCPSDFLLGSERAEEYAFSLYGTSSTFWNRLVRTRMLGGVRGRGLISPPTRFNGLIISSFFLAVYYDLY